MEGAEVETGLAAQSVPAETDVVETAPTAEVQTELKDASEIFGEGAQKAQLRVPNGRMDLVVRPDGSASVTELLVEPDARNQGIGTQLQKAAQEQYPRLQGQVSSVIAARNAYKLGRRMYGRPDATLEETLAAIREDSSTNMVTPEFQSVDIDGNPPAGQAQATNPLKTAKASVPDRVEFNPQADPDLVDGRGEPDLELPDSPSGSPISGGEFESRGSTQEELNEEFDSIDYQDSFNRYFAEADIDKVLRAYRKHVAKILSVPLAPSIQGAHFRGSVAINANSLGAPRDQRGMAYVIAHELGHASHSLLGDVLNTDAAIQAEIAPGGTIETLLYPGLREKVSAASNPDNQFFNYLLSANEMIAEFNVARMSDPAAALEAAPALTAALESAQDAPNLIVKRSAFPTGIGNVVAAVESVYTSSAKVPFEVRKDSVPTLNVPPLSAMLEHLVGGRGASAGTMYARREAAGLAPPNTGGNVGIEGAVDYIGELADNGVIDGLTPDSDIISAFLRGYDNTVASLQRTKFTVRTRLAAPASTLSTRFTRGGIGLLPSTEAKGSIFNTQAALDAVSKRIGVGLKPILIKEADIPAEVRAQIPADRQAKGYTYKGQAFVVEEAITGEADLEATIREEVFHRGLPQLLGKDFNAILDGIFNRRGGVPGLIKLAETLGDPQFASRYRTLISTVQAKPGSDQARIARRELVQEVLARSAENPSIDKGLIPALKRVYAQLRKFMKKLGLPVDLTSNADLLLMAREGFKAGRDSNSAVDDGSVQFSLASDNEGLLTNSPDGKLNVTDLQGTRQASTLRTRATDDAQGYKTLVEGWINGKRSGEKGKLRSTIANSEWYNKLQQTISQVHAPLVQHDVNINKAAAGLDTQVFSDLNSADSFLEARPLLQQVLDRVTDTRQALSPASYVVLQANKARDIFNRTAVGADGKTLQNLEADVALHLRALRDATGESEALTMKSANRFAVAKAAKDRNRVLWYTVGAKLGDSALNSERAALVARLQDGDASVWPELVDLVDTHKQRPEDYTASGMSDAEADAYLQAAAADPSTFVHYENLFAGLRAMVEATNNLDKITGKYSNSVDKVSRAYGWQDTYLPFKGQDEDSDGSMRGLYGGALDDSFQAVTGRQELPDILSTVIRQAGKAAEYNAAQEVAESIMINVAAQKNSPDFRDIDRKGLFKGSLKEYEINSASFKKQLSKKEKNRIIYFNPDNDGSSEQTAMIIKLSNPAGVDAIKGKSSEAADELESILRKGKIPQATSFVSSLLTYRNAPFLPFDAIRTTLTYAYNIGTDEDFGAVQDYTRTLMSNGYMSNIAKFSKFLAQKDFAGLDAYVAAEGPNSVAAQLDEFIKLGGRNEFVDSIKLDPLETTGAVGSAAGGARKALQGFDSAFQAINNATDLMGRFAFYKTKVDRGMPKKAAAAQAVNLANFGARGTWSGPLGGIYAFFRATTSGAFGQANQLLNGNNTGPMMIAGAGAGAMLYALAYAMSDTDDEGNNLVAEMDGKRFIKDFSFRLAGEDRRFGLGFGGIANSISAGMQVVRFSLGHQSLQDSVDNMISAVKDTSAVVPLSGIGITSDPLSFFADSVTPSLGKPILQFLTNTNGLGFDVYQGEADNPYGGRLNTKGTLAEDIAIAASQAGIVDVNPDILQLFAQSYLGTVWSAMNSADEIYSEFTDEEHTFNWRKGTYLGNQFYGPESFTQVQSDYYDKVAFSLDQEFRIKELEKAGYVDAAAALADDEAYQEALPIAKQAKKDLENINKQFKDTLYNAADFTDGQRKNAYNEASVLRRQTMRDYLDDIAIRNQIRLN